jgi:hypothetical protein
MEAYLGIPWPATLPDGSPNLHHVVKVKDFSIKQEKEGLEQVINGSKSLNKTNPTTHFESGTPHQNTRSDRSNDLHHLIKEERIDIKEEKGSLEQVYVDAKSNETNITAPIIKIDPKALLETWLIIKGINIDLPIKYEDQCKDGSRNEIGINKMIIEATNKKLVKECLKLKKTYSIENSVVELDNWLNILLNQYP